MSVYTRDILDRKTGRVLDMTRRPAGSGLPWLFDGEVAYCRETGEVVYLPKP